jgi:hypothetical protein
MRIRPVEPPHLGRSVLIQVLALAAGALASDLPFRHKAPNAPPPAPPHKEERRIRVVKLEKPPPPQPKPPEAKPQPRPPPAVAAKPVAPPKPPAAVAKPSPPAARPSPPRAVAAVRAPPLGQRPAPTVIAADSTAVHGVRMRVLIPRGADDLASHLRNSGGCLVVSRLVGGSAEVVSVLGIAGGRAFEQSGPPCSGVPRLLRDSGLNAALGDPLGRARASNPADDLVLQVLLTDNLPAVAQRALRRRFGDVSEEEMGRLAAQSGYELTCFAEPMGAVRCE